jgi:malate synthase
MVNIGNLQIADSLNTFVEDELLPGTGIEPAHFWTQLETIVAELGPQNAANLDRRDELQTLIDEWHRSNKGGHARSAYTDFLREIGYLRYYADDVKVATDNVDTEIAEISGPQLVVPLDNSRYALNAANARWGSFYDALYGSDAIDEGRGCSAGKKYNPIRGDQVINTVRDFLDRHFSLDQASHHWTVKYEIVNGDLVATSGDGTTSTLLRPERFVAYTGDPSKPDSVLLRKNGLGLIISFGEGFFIGRRDHANIYDVHLESAVTVIMDCEDSVCAVDVDDKLTVYGNWLGLMTGTLTRRFTKGGEVIERSLEADKIFTAADGGDHVEHGRALMLVRNVGHHLSTDAVLCNGEEIPETFLDAMITSAAAMHDLRGSGTFRNSRTRSVYIVKPKMHGPDEVALACQLFDRVEDALGLDRNTLKMGIMDEERRTSLGLKACINVARNRLVFINTGFLDRTGDEIHTDMEAGPVLPKGEMKGATWLRAYEDSNVDTGLACGLKGRAQIGKGMWAKPSDMAEMLKTKIGHPLSGATTAWVPSPTAATLHATHYFLLDVADRQRDLIGRPRIRVGDMTAIPTLPADRTLSTEDIQRELENNAQSILGYVVRWVGHGVGCSTVPDIDDVGLMEDLATLRISSQHVANWLHHGVLSKDQVQTTMQRMAGIVDQQNSDDAEYEPMAPDFANSIPFQAALELVLSGRDEKNGYSERILRQHRRAMKATLGS